MSAIIGLDGFEPTLNVIDCTKKIAIANKEVYHLWVEYILLKKD